MSDIYFYREREPYGELTNFWSAPFILDGAEWPTVEHYFQAQKALDPQEKERIRLADTPMQVKQMGQKVSLRPDWEQVKEEVMLRALRAKFDQHPDLAMVLLRSGDSRLHEDAPRDRYWGVKGKDRLGALLMQVRKEISGTKGKATSTGAV